MGIAFYATRPNARSSLSILGYIRRSNKRRLDLPMPELPEVETTRRGIAPTWTGACDGGTTLRPAIALAGSAATLAQRLVGADDRPGRAAQQVPAVSVRHGYAARPSRHDRQSACFQRCPATTPHDHVDLVFDNGVDLRYHDPRRFGAMLWLPDAAHHPLLRRPRARAARPRVRCRSPVPARTRKRSAAIKLALDGQPLVVGVGNIYANESLFRAGIRPTRAANRISRARLRRLLEAVRETLAEAIAKGGSTLRDYVDSDGARRLLPARLFRLRPRGRPCRVCGTAIRAVRLGGRATTYCPTLPALARAGRLAWRALC